MERAIALHGRMPIRSERHEHFLALFVAVPQIAVLEKSDWQVIYGRRGTGKTFLLGVTESRSRGAIQTRADYFRRRDLCIRLSAQDFVASPVGGTEVSDKDRGTAYFQMFLEILCEEISQRVDTVLGSPGFLDVVTGGRKRLKGQLEDATLELLSLAQIGSPVTGFADQKLVKDQKFEKTKSSEMGGKIAVSVDPNKPSASAGATLQGSRSTSTSKQEQMHSESAVVPRYSQVRRKLLEIIELLNVRRINILIDEWSVLDTHATTAIQPQFAELLKRSFAGTDKISVKIATNRYQTKLNNQGSSDSFLGLKLNADIFEGANLDRVLLRDSDLARFFENMLFKRMSFGVPDLRAFLDSERSLKASFITSIFRTRGAFVELVKGAAGVPRDFLNLFNELSKQQNESVEKKWTISDVRDTLRLRSNEGLVSVDGTSIGNDVLISGIYPVVRKTGSRIFLAKKSDISRLSNAFDELFEKRFIHDFDLTAVSPTLRTEFQAFLLDYGLFLDWQRVRSASMGAGSKEDQPELGSREILAAHTIDLSAIGQVEMITCPSCTARFLPDERSYVVKGLCPVCFEKIAETDRKPANGEEPCV